MNPENPSQPENIEDKLKQETIDLEKTAGNVTSNLDTVDSSSKDRQRKIFEFLERNWFTITGGSVGVGGAWGLGESMISGNWERIIAGLALGAGAGKALEMVIERIIEKSKKSE